MRKKKKIVFALMPVVAFIIVLTAVLFVNSNNKFLSHDYSNNINDSYNNIDFVYQERPIVGLGESEQIVVGFKNPEEAYNSKLVYSKLDGSSSNEVAASAVCDGMAYYSIPFTSNNELGYYNLSSLVTGKDGQNTQNIEKNSQKGYSFEVVNNSDKSMFDNLSTSMYSIDNNGKLNAIDKPSSNLNQMFVADDSALSQQYKESLESNNGFVVALDPGHGGYDPGACCGALRECDCNWRVAMACKAELEQFAGVSVYITRGEGECPGLDERVYRSINNGANLFVSLHMNAGGGSGVEVWIPYAGGWHSEINGITGDIGARIREKFGQYFGLGDRGNKSDTWDGRTYPDGSIGDYLGVLYYSRYHGLPGMLVEHAFIDGDYGLLLNPANLDLMGVLDAQAIAEHYGFTKDRYSAYITYGEYKVKSSVDANCVFDVKNSSVEPAEDIVLNKEIDIVSQEWTIENPDDRGYVSIVNKNSNLCLDIYGGKVYDGARVCQYNNLMADTQRWKIVYDEGMCFIVSKANVNFCITVDDTTSKIGDKLKIGNYYGWGIQKFDFDAIVNPTDPSIEDGYYKIVSVDNPKMYLEANVADDLRWTLKTYDNPDTFSNQIFNIKKEGNFSTLTDCVTDSLVSLNQNGAANVGNLIVQWANINHKSQEWSLQVQPDGSYMIQSVSSCLYMGPYKTAKVNRASQLCGCTKSNLDSLKWKLVKVDDPYKKIDEAAKKHQSAISDGTYVIGSKAGDNLVWDVAGYSKEDYGNILLYNNCMTVNQQFEVSHDNDGYVHFKNVNSNKYVDINSGKKISNKNICQYHSHNEKSQQWVVVPNGDGSYKIMSALIYDLCISSESIPSVSCTNIVSKYNQKDASSNFVFSKIGGDIPESDKDIVDGYYQITNKMDPLKGLDVGGYSSKDGANIDLWDVNNTYMNIVFKIQQNGKYHTITCVSSNMCLSYDATTTLTTGNVVQRKSDLSNYQTWSITKQNDGFYTCVCVNNGLAMSIDGAKAVNGANISCSLNLNEDHQKWTLKSVNDPFAELDSLAYTYKDTIADGTYIITSNAGNNLALDVAGFSRENFGNILLYDNLQASNQQWLVSHDEKGYVHIRNANSGKYIDIDGESMCRGANICQYTQHSEASQKWIILPATNGYEIRSGLIFNYNMVASTAPAYRMTNIQTGITDSSISQIFTFNEYTGNTPIMYSPRSSADQMVRFFNSTGHVYPSHIYSNKGASTINDFCRICFEEAQAEDVDPAVLFCQAMLETGWLQFGGQVQPEQCNFGGIGATDGGTHGATFPNVSTGLKAQVQHLKAYACDLRIKVPPCVDPRFDLVIRGCAPNVEDLGNGKWATSSTYGQDILNLMRRLFNI